MNIIYNIIYRKTTHTNEGPLLGNLFRGTQNSLSWLFQKQPIKIIRRANRKSTNQLPPHAYSNQRSLGV